MTKDFLANEYFKWMVSLITKRTNLRNATYYRLLHYLDSRTFTYKLELDSNRATDGINLRYRFGYENKYSNQLIAEFLDDRPCSVLEMMVALAFKLEENIMDDPDKGNRTGTWFWDMIANLGLKDMNDMFFDDSYANQVLTRFLKREYEPNGRGGLFIVRHCEKDLRTSEIWYQMMWYLEELSDN